ncbi:hypothetical protein [Acrocarpospora sp. B8E8]|uniref:hypothetical protein n=1 Tax=Acrocarpospora sp. B8E8 TaxID=3153572 RepID=UPI00325C8BA1
MTTDRAAYVAGLRALADLLDTVPEVPEPSYRLNIELHGWVRPVPREQQIAQALAVIAHLDDPEITLNIRRGTDCGDLFVLGEIHGLRIRLRMRAEFMCEEQPKARRKADMWIVPAALQEAVEARRAAGPLPVLHHPTYCGECGHDIRPVPMTEVQRVLDRHAAEQPEESATTGGTHWLTRFDEDGDPLGEVCDCEIGADHLPSGDLMFAEEGDGRG